MDAGMSAPQPEPATPLVRGWVRWLLIASLTLNVLIIGLMVGVGLGRVAHGPPPVLVRDLGFGPFTEALSREDSAALRRDYDAATGRDGALPGGPPGLSRRELRADAATILAALRAEPFDPAALAAAFDGQRSRMQERMALGQTLLTRRIVAMTPEQRSALADRLERGLRRGPPSPPGPPRD